MGTKNVNKNEFAHSKFLTGTEQNSNGNRKLKQIELLDTVKFQNDRYVCVEKSPFSESPQWAEHNS